MGKGVALNTGFDYTLQRVIAAVITLDADGQHDPDEIPLFIEAFRAGKGDLIIGQRSYMQIPGIRRWGNRTGRWLLEWAMGQPVPDNQSGYRLLSRAVLQKVRPTSSRFEAEVEILLQTQQAGFRIGWVPIKTIYADEVSHYQPVRDSLLFLKMIWRIRRARLRGGTDRT
jgi:glycosyltransferase involved in cell wall biosynthesis